MLTFDSLPQARVVRKGGQLVAPPPAPPTDDHGPVATQMRSLLAAAIGLWPLTCVVALAIGMLVMAGNNGAP